MKKGIIASIFVCAMLLSVTMFPGVMAVYTGTDYVGYLPTGLATLSAHWKLDETSGSIAHDETGNYNNGTIYGATINQPGKLGTSYEFNGINDYVNVPDDDSLDFLEHQEFGVFAWVKIGDALDPAGPIVTKWSAFGGYYIAIDSSGYPQFVITTNSASRLCEYRTSMQGAGWTHIGGVRSGDTMYLYVNGVLRAWQSAADVSDDLSNMQPLRMGGTTGDYYDGNIDDVRIYLDDYNPIATRIAHWKLEETSGTKAYDDTANNHDGTHQGTPSIMQLGKVGSYCYRFQDDDYVNVSDHSQLDIGTGNFSVFMWFRQVGGGNQIFFEKIDTAGYKMETVNSAGDDFLRATLDFGGTTCVVTGSTEIVDYTWYHFGMVRNNNTLEIWVNGSLEDSTPGASGDISNAEELWFGNTQGNPQYDIYLDDIRIYDEAVVPAGD